MTAALPPAMSICSSLSREIFTTLMQTCNLAYDETIFVDDTKANAQAAYNLGITGILYKNPKSFTRALGACGIEVD